MRAPILSPPSSTNNTQSFLAGGVTVIVDSLTVYANVSGFAGLAQGQRVEVHGLRDANNNLRATRVEAVGAADGVDELRGVVSGLNAAASQFTLNNGITVNYSGATFSPAGTTAAALANGLVVEVRGSLSGTVFTATQVDVEDLEDSVLGAKENEKTEYEGFVTDYSGSTTLKVAGRAVQVRASTRFIGGAAADLANNVKVEAEGVTVGGVLVASKIEFRQTRVLLHGLASAVNVASGTVTVLSQTVTVNAQTRLDTRGTSGSSLSDLVAGVDCVEVRAYLDGTTLTAEEVKEPSSCSKELVQARVVAENETTFTLTFLNSLSASLGGAGTQFRNTSGQSYGAAGDRPARVGLDVPVPVAVAHRAVAMATTNRSFRRRGSAPDPGFCGLEAGEGQSEECADDHGDRHGQDHDEGRHEEGHSPDGAGALHHAEVDREQDQEGEGGADRGDRSRHRAAQRGTARPALHDQTPRPCATRNEGQQQREAHGEVEVPPAAEGHE